jgi:nucleoside-diphosphate-sugar epimerase
MILVTGGAGYIGSVLVGELLGLGQQVRVVDTMWFGDPFAPHERLQLIRGDLRTPDASWLKDVDAVIHLAGLSNDPTADFAPALNNESNVYATRQLAQLAAEKSKREDREIRYLFASTCSVYYAPTTADSSNVVTMTNCCGSPTNTLASLRSCSARARSSACRLGCGSTWSSTSSPCTPGGTGS